MEYEKEQMLHYKTQNEEKEGEKDREFLESKGKWNPFRWQRWESKGTYSQYFALFLSIGLAVLVNIFLILANRWGFAYSFCDWKLNQENRIYEEKIQEKLTEFLETGQYQKMVVLLERKNQIYENDYKKWSGFYDAVRAQQDFYDVILYYLYTGSENEYKTMNWVENASQNLWELYDSLRGITDSRVYSEEVIPYLMEIQRETEVFLKVYCEWEQEEIDQLPGMKEEEIVVIMNGRMTGE